MRRLKPVILGFLFILTGILPVWAHFTATVPPLAPSTIAYNDGTDPWTLVSTDEAGKIHKYRLDAYGRTNRVIEVFGATTYTTKYGYNLAGDLLTITNNANNVIQYAYNNLGQVVAMADPDMGVWQYQRDYAGRLRKQTDANGQWVYYNYDFLGRVSSRQVYDFKNVLAYGVTNIYDSNGGDSGFTVYSGDLYETIDKEGWEKFSYDLRGRLLKTARYLSKNGNAYTNQFSYDDMDRPTQLIYPNGGPTVNNTYDAGGNLWTVAKASGTTYYSATSFDAVGHLNGVNFGNGVATTYGYYPTTKRLQTISTKSGTLQSLSYTYDAVSNVKTITDGVYTSGTNSASLSSTTYDDLHRLTALTRPSGSVSFTYDSIGNTTMNGEAGTGTYNYGTRMPHAIKSANGKNYAYDLNGNMLVRGTQHLEYDAENHLVLAQTTNSTSTFGYAGDGSRLWKQTASTNGLQVWIGGNYEEKNGKILFHISADGTLVATFDSTASVVDYYQSDNLHSSSILTDGSGNLSQHYEYSAYGRDRAVYSATAFPVSRRFTSQIKDEDTGLYYYGARYYDPELGRFIQPDDIIPDQFNPQSLNRYSYCLNNPLRYTDPTGHQEAEPEIEAEGEITREIRDSTAGLRNRPLSPQARFEQAAVRNADLKASEAYARSRGFSTTESTLSAPETGPSVNPATIGKLDPKMLETPTIPGVARPGRLGSQATQDHIAEVGGKLKDNGWKITGGGGERSEEYIPGTGGGRKGSSYPDITATKEGKTLRVNTIDTRADGVTPSTREGNNAARIRSQKPNDTLILIPKPSE